MKIVIIGDGKVGHKLTAQLSEEDYDIVLIDQNEGKLKEALNRLDIFCITGNGADADVQKEAGVQNADLVIACASTDELNMLSCLLARRLGGKAYHCPCQKSSLLSPDGIVKRRSSFKYGGKSGINGSYGDCQSFTASGDQ